MDISSGNLINKVLKLEDPVICRRFVLRVLLVFERVLLSIMK